ncbi:helix-turn-helix domain-containing protein [Phytohabitans suffuscus]|uniref:HTH cro/C1-type domain-containing protein n=1 Tax=Phytohabitans suffuscus TaxID=624315 RepID=A0A6F8YI80_9ACTN|nr:helix-turn-helix transcriptional regulator [Phytohabitans suffuscus]BCB85743.1 hypothetical protein Psuf_030560 [Phytohabitans suffuscus]
MAEISDDAIDRFYADIGRRIRDARVDSGATQAQLAARVAMTRSSIANIEAGRQRVPVHVLALISEVLKVELVALFSLNTLDEEHSGLVGLSEQLEGELSTTRDFVEGAIAQLGISVQREEEQ